jgi:cell wall-associated NlpC family hydrolase
MRSAASGPLTATPQDPDAAVGTATGCLVVKAAVANLRREPSHASELVSQLILGEAVRRLEDAGAWIRVAGADGYEGWLHAGGVAAAPEAPIMPQGARLVWTRRAGLLVAKPRPDAAPVCDLVLGARARAVEEGEASPGGWRAVRLADGTVAWAEAEGWTEEALRRRRFARDGLAACDTALSLLGVPYLWGGRSSKAFDCSGFVQTVLGLHGVPLPRDAWQQAQTGSELNSEPRGAGLRAGDLVFFAESGGRVTHVALALGERGRFVHCSTARAGVGVDSLATGDPLHVPSLANTVCGFRRHF